MSAAPIQVLIVVFGPVWAYGESYDVRFDLEKLSPMELFALHACVADALRDRGITRTSNNPAEP